MSDEVDYRKILIAYMHHVGECEGIDFLGTGPSEELGGLSPEEAVELAKVRDLGRKLPDRFYDDARKPLQT
jgi:hypothetical protein